MQIVMKPPCLLTVLLGLLVQQSVSQSLGVPSQCSSYTTVSDTTRNTNAPPPAWDSAGRTYFYKCDRGFFTPGVWYRFQDSNGYNYIPTSPPPNYNGIQSWSPYIPTVQCQTQGSGWYSGSVPTSVYSTASANTCYIDNGNVACRSDWIAPVQSTNCGTFLVYKWPGEAASACNLRICTTNQAPSGFVPTTPPAVCLSCGGGAYLSGCTSSNSGSCYNCPASSCSVGEYLTGCSGTSAGACTSCTNKPSSSYSYTSNGGTSNSCGYAMKSSPPPPSTSSYVVVGSSPPPPFANANTFTATRTSVSPSVCSSDTTNCAYICSASYSVSLTSGTVSSTVSSSRCTCYPGMFGSSSVAAPGATNNVVFSDGSTATTVISSNGCSMTVAANVVGAGTCTGSYSVSPCISGSISTPTGGLMSSPNNAAAGAASSATGIIAAAAAGVAAVALF